MAEEHTEKASRWLLYADRQPFASFRVQDESVPTVTEAAAHKLVSLSLAVI